MELDLSKRLGKYKKHKISEYLDRELLIGNFWKGFKPEILNKKMLIVGVGGSGCNVALGLGRMGFQEIVLVDKDKVEASNFTRQVLYRVEDIGLDKARVAGKRMKEHSLGKVKSYKMDILKNRKKFDNLVKDADFVFGLVDNRGGQYFITERCAFHKKPMVSGGTDPVTGLVAVFRYMGGKGYCEECISRSSEKAPVDWLGYYSGISNVKRSKVVKEKIKEYDEKIKHADRCASTYITASCGANLMISAMLGHFMGREVPGLVIFNLLTFDIWKFYPRRWKDCPICERYQDK
ncbi:MAG: ThiF family adenylyltransferase [Thermoplasmata archaeon]